MCVSSPCLPLVAANAQELAWRRCAALLRTSSELGISVHVSNPLRVIFRHDRPGERSAARINEPPCAYLLCFVGATAQPWLPPAPLSLQPPGLWTGLSYHWPTHPHRSLTPLPPSPSLPSPLSPPQYDCVCSTGGGRGRVWQTGLRCSSHLIELSAASCDQPVVSICMSFT